MEISFTRQEFLAWFTASLQASAQRLKFHVQSKKFRNRLRGCLESSKAEQWREAS
jgi:hypothetical protein